METESTHFTSVNTFIASDLKFFNSLMRSGLESRKKLHRLLESFL